MIVGDYCDKEGDKQLIKNQLLFALYPQITTWAAGQASHDTEADRTGHLSSDILASQFPPPMDSLEVTEGANRARAKSGRDGVRPIRN